MFTETHQNRADWNSFTQFIYELIAGPVRRNIFTQWELELMFDLEGIQMRKSARAEMLRRYIKTVSQTHTEGAEAPPRLAQFVAAEPHARRAETKFLEALEQKPPIAGSQPFREC